MSLSTRQKIEKHISSKEFVIAGTAAWDDSGVSFGATTIFNKLWVYNRVKSEICGSFKFIKRDFPLEVTKEFWIIDQLNCIGYTDVDSEQAMKRIRLFLLESKINREGLKHQSNLYGNEETKRLIYQILPSSNNYKYHKRIYIIIFILAIILFIISQ